MTTETTVEQRLKLLFSLQGIDLELQEIEELKGDLPHIVRDLEARHAAMTARLEELNASMKELRLSRERADNDIVDIAAKVERYKGQQMSVKSNRQYDALTREIEIAEQKSLQLQKGMGDAENRLQVARTDAEALRAELETLSGELKERQKELKEVNKEHEKSELALRHQREKIVVRLDRDDLDRYERIARAKGGKAVVQVRRNACGGCFSRVPPQKILELRQNSRFYLCEHCGRILVSETLNGHASPA